MHYDTSTELLITPRSRGVSLIRPLQKEHSQPYFRIGQVLNFPCNVYFLNTESIIQNINEHSAHSCGYHSIRDAIGRTVFDVLPNEEAINLTRIDKEVLRTNHVKICDDTMTGKDGTRMQFLTIKSPVYHPRNNNIIGVFGCSVLLGQHPIAESIALMTQLGLLYPTHRAQINRNTTSASHEASINSYNYYLTKRELEVLSHLTRGKTAKEIGHRLNISFRTVQHHIENIKSKTNSLSKSELIDKFA